MQAQIEILQALVASLTPKEGEIYMGTKEALQEEITKVITTCMEDKLEATKQGWVVVVKKNIKREAKEEVLIVHTILEEEEMRQAKRLNICVIGIAKKEGLTPKANEKTL